jgi:hypothetical protein
MLFEEAFNWIDDCEWVVQIEEGKMGDHYIDETYMLKEGAPEDIRRRWEELCADHHADVDTYLGKSEPVYL